MFIHNDDVGIINVGTSELECRIFTDRMTASKFLLFSLKCSHKKSCEESSNTIKLLDGLTDHPWEETYLRPNINSGILRIVDYYATQLCLC